MDCVAEKILGYSIKTKWQITLHYLIPCCAELIVYTTVMVSDIGLVFQHFADGNKHFAYITAGIILFPALIMIPITLFSPDRINNLKTSNKFQFVGLQFFYFLIFPFGALYRFSRKIFWCIESLFHDKGSQARSGAISKAAESSQFELYHFLQSFFHCALQIVFQLFIILRNDMFRNYDTAFVQGVSIVFGLIKMSMSAESYQRFESKKLVGKNYPWHPMKHEQKMQRSFSENDIVIKSKDEYFPILDHSKMNDYPSEVNLFDQNITDDEKLNSTVEQNVHNEVGNREHSHRKKNSQNKMEETLHQLSNLRKSFLSRINSFVSPEEQGSDGTENNVKQLNLLNNDENDNIDCVLPTRRQVILGIEEDDLVAKFIAFLGWNFFLVMRLMSLSSFSVFHIDICGYICLAHYCGMLVMLFHETKLLVKWQRTAFHFILAYIYLFNLIEFKIKFKRVRFWYLFYFFIVFAENFGMTFYWYFLEVYLDTWWFELIFLVILQSGIMSLMCFLLYFFYLKPVDKILYK